jgi:hypothetical protein
MKLENAPPDTLWVTCQAPEERRILVSDLQRRGIRIGESGHADFFLVQGRIIGVIIVNGHDHDTA